ncbi:hypothetical protein N7462_004825 [Penicillium macrosclerotiorum]|uniref:uncharacterized protein n=1 Tax=Penicillium macrosclerotiorum TaxID=303699 RepID=UPI0025499923|nr:uncharacterized protein N7462_004825 [Penicillium macrosclerotiorum]KAJ5690433.1 hypothetical protein N7462_004825 [Penicillium macrosclerotiorum]
MIPIQSRIRDMALAKSSTLAPVASTDPALVSFTFSGSSFSCSPLSNPSAPPPTPTDSLLDIHPRKSSFASEYGMGAACAFPSWPNRPSLSSADSADSFTNAYLSDEDLLWMPENAGTAPDALPEMATEDGPVLASMTMEQQLARMRAVAEEEDRLRFLAKVEAHARATQAIRQAQQAIVNGRDSSKRKKRRVVPCPKRRAHSSSAKVPTVAHCT